jgi:hypothetical protein
MEFIDNSKLWQLINASLKISVASAQKGGGSTRTDLSDNYVMVEISTNVDITFFTQNKPVNNHPKFGRRFVGHPVYYKESGTQMDYLENLIDVWTKEDHREIKCVTMWTGCCIAEFITFPHVHNAAFLTPVLTPNIISQMEFSLSNHN